MQLGLAAQAVLAVTLDHLQVVNDGFALFINMLIVGYHGNIICTCFCDIGLCLDGYI